MNTEKQYVSPCMTVLELEPMTIIASSITPGAGTEGLEEGNDLNPVKIANFQFNDGLWEEMP